MIFEVLSSTTEMVTMAAPDPGGGQAPPGADKFLTMLRWAAWIAAGVCVLSGTAFGQVGRDHIRISYANSRENLAEALERIRDFVGSLR